MMQGPVWPMVSEKSAQLGLNLMNNNQHEREVEVAIGQERPKSEAEEMQLPLERLVPYPLLQAESVEGKEACTLCEYLLHYIQNAVSNPVTEVTYNLNNKNSILNKINKIIFKINSR